MIMSSYKVPEKITGEFEFISSVRSGANSELAILYDKICRRKVVLKSGKAELIENEARIMSEFSGKGIPEIYCSFEQNGRTYLIRQYIPGMSLHERIMSEGPFSVSEAIRIGIDVCGIISRLHSADPPVINRDIKSDNIIIDPDGNIFIIDFGISREYDANASRDTQVMGTPVTAPPEQFGYGQTDERSDIYAIGVLINELATGSPKINTEALPGKLASVVKRCTEFSPENRFRNAEECKKALLKIRKKPSSGLVPIAAAACIAAAAIALVIALVLNIGLNKTNNSVQEDTTSAYVSESNENITDTADSTAPTETADTGDGGGKNFIQLDSSYVGDWEYGARIPKKMLEGFDGDLKFELEIETVDEGKEGDYHMLVPVGADDRWEKIASSTYLEHADDGMWILVGKHQKTCTFTISKDVIDTIGENGIEFQIYNLIIKSAVIEEASDDEVKYEKITDTKTPYTVTFDNEYKGDYALCGMIPLSVLESYEGDIKMTFDIEVGGRYNYANFVPIAIAEGKENWIELKEEIKCEYESNEYGFIEMKKDQTECTLIIAHDAVEMCGKYGIGFKSVNIIFKSATLVDADA